MRRHRPQRTERKRDVIESTSQAVQSLIAEARRRGDSVLGLTDRAAATFQSVRDQEEALLQELQQNAGLQQHGLWADLLTVHGLLARGLTDLAKRSSTGQQRHARITEASSAFLNATAILFALVDRDDAFSDRLVKAIARGGTFQACAQLLAVTSGELPRELVLVSAIRLCSACCSGAGVQLGGMATRVAPLEGELLYTELVRALASSHLLEHAARMQVQLEEAAGGTTDHTLQCQHAFDNIVEVLTLPLKAGRLQAELAGRAPMRASPSAAAVAETVEVLPEVRAVLSGTCLQFWLGRRLVVARLRAGGGSGPTFGLPDAQRLLAAPGALGGTSDSARDLRRRLGTAALSWQFLALPARLAPREDAAAAASAAAIADPPAAGAAAWAPSGMPYSAVQVYTLVHGGLEVVLGGCGAAGRAAAVQLLPPAICLTRLALLQLRPRSVAARLAALWRNLAALLSSIHAAEVCALGATAPLSLRSCLHDMRLLLRMELEPPGAAPSLAADDCSFSLRCALAGGLLPAAEALLRGLASAPPSKDATQLAFHTINTLLRASGVWPALLTHGSVREAVSLIITLNKVLTALRCGSLPYIISAKDENQGAPLSCPAAEGGRALGNAYMAALLEQAVAAAGLLPPGIAAPPAAVAADPHAASASSGGEAGSNGYGFDAPCAAGGSPGSGSSRDGERSAPSHATDPLALNNALEWDCRLDMDWLARAGGRPTPGSPAAQQQLLMTALLLNTWLPQTTGPQAGQPQVSPCVWLALCRSTLAAALQGLKARVTALRATVAEASPTGGNAAEGAVGGAGDGRSDAQAAAAANSTPLDERTNGWMLLLVEGAETLCWVSLMLHSAADGTMCAAWQPALPLALDILEALLAAASTALAGTLLAQLHVFGAAAIAEPHVRSERLLELVAAHGRTSLLAVLRADHEFTIPLVVAQLEPRRGDVDRSGDGGVVVSEDAHEALAALRREVARRHDLDRLPTLPAPWQADERVQAMPGVRWCANPVCVSLEGPSEATAASKTCSRCRAAHYCSAACQLLHWRGGHSRGCRPAAEAPAGGAGS